MKAETQTLREALEAFIAANRANANPQRDSAARTVFQKFCKFVGKEPSLAEVTDDAIKAFREKLFEKQTALAVKTEANLLRQIRDDVLRGAYHWHKKPAPNDACPVCGLPPSYKGEHRAVERPDGKIVAWQIRHFGRGGMKVRQVGNVTGGKRPNRMPTGPGSETVKMIARAATLQAHGRSRKDIAKEMEVDLGMVGWWHAQYSELWQKAFDHAVEQQVALIREVAGTEAALQHARAVIDLRSPAARRINEELSAKAAMTPSAEMTLTQFYWSYFKPVCLGSTCALGVANYERIMRAWMLLMGDPPLKAITAATLAIFRDRVAKLPGLKGLGYVSLVTVNNYMRWLQAVIDKSGPPMRGQRDAAGVLDRVPWIKLAVAPLKMPRTVPDVLLNQLYTGLVAAEVPRVDGFKPPAWWRCLIVLTLNTGLRRGTLFGLKMADIDWQKRTILIRPSNNKSRKVFSVHLNETAYRHLLAIRTDREKVFPWPHCSRCFHTTFHRLQNASGIAQEEHFGLHALRRTLATMLYEQSPGAAQIALGHSDQRTTQAHYVAPNAMVARALDALPQPEAFKGRLDGAA